MKLAVNPADINSDRCREIDHRSEIDSDVHTDQAMKSASLRAAVRLALFQATMLKKKAALVVIH